MDTEGAKGSPAARRSRDASRPEGTGHDPDETVDHTGDDQAGRGDTFVIQEHQARTLHWDFRLERDGVLVSWAVPKGLPVDPATNHLARHVEDHPADYAAYEGTIGEGEYGAGTVTRYDHGTYELAKWSDREVKVVLRGQRVQGRYVLFRTRGHDWMVHRMDPPADPGWRPPPNRVAPMLAVPGRLPADEKLWAFEVKWDGVRVIAFVAGGRVRAQARSGRDVTVAYPELRQLGRVLGATQVVLDGEVVALGPDGRPDFGLLAHRMHVADANTARRLAAATPVTYVAFDLLHLDGHDTTGLTYDERRALLEGLPGMDVPARFDGDGKTVLAASREAGLEGIVAKRRTSTYQAGRRSGDWVKVKNFHRQSAVVGGWEPGEGKRSGTVGALLLGLPVPGEPGRLTYVGQVGTGFTEATLRRLKSLLEPLRTEASAFVEVPREYARGAVWVRPELVAEVDFGSWTSDNRLRHPSFKGLRDDVDPSEVVREDDGQAGD